MKMNSSTSVSILMLLVFVLASSAKAQINDYQIRRLILYKTDCTFDGLTSETTDTGGMDFLVSCENVSFYPDGVLIQCADQDDDSSCVVKTESKVFRYDLLRPEQDIDKAM